MAVFDVQSLEAQKSSIRPLINTPLKINDKWYLIDAKWFKQWKNYVNYDKQADIEDNSESPGPVDNSALFESGTKKLRNNIIEREDFELVPEKAWYLFTQWYSLAKGQDPIARKVINKGTYSENLVVEIITKELKIFKYNCTEFKVMNFSEVDTIEMLEKAVKKEFGIAEKDEIRLWNRFQNLLEPLKKMQATLNDAALSNNSEIVVEIRGGDGVWPHNQNKITQRIESFPNELSKTNYQRGLCGLTNLGNTCFMNSSLQCLSNVPALTNFMLSDKWIKELNKENPLGMRGEIATSYAELITNMWSGKLNCYAPRQFKVAVGRFKPEFSGYQQQDSQELMAFLLDGLHEDLNRIRKKPYIETKEAENRPDEIVANETWSDYIKRNDSIIVDTFHGLLKSTLVCPQCDKISIKFDPFCYLSLPLPVKSHKQLDVFYVSEDPSVRVKQVRLTISKMGLISDACKALSEIVSCNPQNLKVADVYNNRFHKTFKMHDSISIINDKDKIYFYHLPSLQSTSTDVVPLAIYLRESNKDRSLSIGQSPLFGIPFFLVVNRHQTTYEDIYNKIINKMKRFLKDAPSKSSIIDDSSHQSTSDAESISDDKEISLESRSSDYMDTSSTMAMGSDVQNHGIEDDDNNNNKWQTKTSRHRMFHLSFVNCYGCDNIERITDYKSTVKFPVKDDIYLAAEFSPSSKRKHYNEKEAEAKDVEQNLDSKSVFRKGVGLGDCLDLFTTMEKLGEQDPWYCPSCKKHQQATKKFDLWKLPKILIIHLKRFSYNRFWRDKLEIFIDFPVEGLDMSKFLINKNHPPAVYDLIAVSNHYGGLGGGHYTAYAKNHHMDRWYYFDDSCVSPCEQSRVVTKEGYVLVYELRKGNKSNNNFNSAVDPEDTHPPSYEESMETSA